MTKINIDKATLFVLFVIFICTTINLISFHNIDLSWNAKYLDADNSLIDTNGIVTQDLNAMYSKGMMSLLFSSFFMSITIFAYVFFRGVHYSDESKTKK